MKNSFPLLDSLIGFVGKKDFQNKLRFFLKKEESGYEKWLQHEMAYWLEIRDGHAVDMEWGVDTDKRRSIKDRLLVDLRVNMKSQRNDSFHAIELKVTNKTTGALRQSVLDLLRLKTARGKNWSFRSVTSIAFVNNDEVGKYADYWKDLKSGSKSNWIFKDCPIGKTGVSMYVLSWRVPPRSVHKLQFEGFTDFLMETAVNLGIDTFEISAQKRKPKLATLIKIDRSKKNIKKLTAS